MDRVDIVLVRVQSLFLFSSRVTVFKGWLMNVRKPRAVSEHE